MKKIIAFLFILSFLFSIVSAASAQSAYGDGNVGTYETFARIRADDPSRSSLLSWRGLPNPPATFPLQFKKNGGMENRFLTSGQLAYFKKLNPVYWGGILFHKTGWCNYNDPEWDTKSPYLPKCLSLGFEWNVIKVDMDNIVNGWVAVECMTSSSPNLVSTNYSLTPWLVHQFTVITPGGNQIYPAGGKRFFVPLLCTKTLFVPLDKIELFPATPVQAAVTVGRGLNIRQCVQDQKIGALMYGTKITILEYFPRADRIWAKVVTDQNVTGCVAILWRDGFGKPVYYTSWFMAAPPPLPY